MTNAVTGGLVSIEDGKKAAEEFAPARKVRVELSFSVPEGGAAQGFLDGVAALAQAKVSELLGAKPAPVVRGHTAAEAAASKPAETPKAETAAQKKKREAAEAAANKPAERTKADLEREALEAARTAPEGELLEDEPEITADGKTVAAEDDLSDILGETPPVVITDKELGDAVQKKNAERKAADPNWAPAKIRDVIAKFSGGKRANDIPNEKRAAFLAEIVALK